MFSFVFAFQLQFGQVDVPAKKLHLLDTNRCVPFDRYGCRQYKNRSQCREREINQKLQNLVFSILLSRCKILFWGKSWSLSCSVKKIGIVQFCHFVDFDFFLWSNPRFTGSRASSLVLIWYISWRNRTLPWQSYIVFFFSLIIISIFFIFERIFCSAYMFYLRCQRLVEFLSRVLIDRFISARRLVHRPAVNGGCAFHHTAHVGRVHH